MTLFPTSHEVAPAVSAVGAGLGAVAIRTKVLHGKIVFAEAAVSGVPVAGVIRYEGAPLPFQVDDEPAAPAVPAENTAPIAVVNTKAEAAKLASVLFLIRWLIFWISSWWCRTVVNNVD